MTENLVIIGCGGFGREAADVVDAINHADPTWKLLGFVDDRPTRENIAKVERRGSLVIGDMSSLECLDPTRFVVAIGDPSVRRELANLAEQHDWLPALLVHPTATFGAGVRLGAGSIVCANVSVGSDVRVGRHVHLDRAVQVGHDSEIADFVTAHPAAIVSGDCTIQSEVELGTNCTVLPKTVIGHRSIVGASACVIRDVSPDTTVRGVPAR